MNELTMALLDISTSQLRLSSTRGPSLWLEVKDDPDERGERFDFQIERCGHNVVIQPTCNAALQWLYFHLPQDCPRANGAGFLLSADESTDVVAAMARDGLLSEEDYVYNMNAEERDRMAGERR